jgi:transcriptional regulator with PAS, ATPase and Fis domain
MTSSDPSLRSRSPVLIGSSRAIEAVRASADRVARGDAKVLITGESGVGKDVLVRYIHAHSTRSQKPLVAVNCAGITETLLESELFGHVKGAFTGAYRDKAGKLQLAHQGTIFLDEVGEMTMRMQALLLRFLESGEIHQVGADAIQTRVDVRVIAATNCDLPQMIAQGQFRKDLFYRIKVVEIYLPPLRDRPEDIRPLIEHLSMRYGREPRFSDAAWRALENYRWPGNVREVQNVVEQIIWMTERDTIEPGDLPIEISMAAPAGSTGPVHDRRRQTGDALFEGLVSGRYTFWDRVHPLFLSRDITRHDLRHLIRRGLATTNGSYRRLLDLFGMKPDDYKRLLNFLTTHECAVDSRAFKSDAAAATASGPAGNFEVAIDDEGTEAVRGE